MKLLRRQWLQWSAASLGVGVLSGCESVEQRLTRVSLSPDALSSPYLSVLSAGSFAGQVSPELRLLNRAAYGPRPGDLEYAEKMGPKAYIEEQLHPDEIQEEPAEFWRIRALGDSLNPDPGLLFDQDDRRLVQALRQAAVLRAVYTRKQLNERMVEFWSDHFNIYAFKGQGPQLKVVDDHETIRTHALGKFRDLLGASARSAAMLGYLDNTVNRKGVPNENYARELMELHTLGVHGGYTQKDVKEVARCLTGWTSERHWHRGRFLFDASTHDDGAKRVLGVDIPPGGGIRDGDRVLDLVAAHPATAHHLCQKLCIHFLGAAPESEVSRLADVWRKSKGDIRIVMRSLLNSKALHEAPPILKRPLDYIASALRALNADTDGGQALQQHLDRMGQPLFAWPMPDGFPEKTTAWTGAMIPRWNFAMALASTQIQNTSVDFPALIAAGKSRGLDSHDALLEMVFARRSSDQFLAPLRDRRADHPQPPEYAAVLLMSPEFQWR